MPDRLLITLPRSISALGLEETTRRWERHWAKALSPNDLKFLVEVAHCTTIRLPIGYFTLGKDFCRSTAFDGEPALVYTNAWKAVLDICKTLASVGISVILDMHALPGGANKDSHSGTSSPKGDLWGSSKNIKLAKQSIHFVAQEVVSKKIFNCAGLQLCNEACWGAKGMYDFYADVLDDIACIDSSTPVYISDAWNLEPALKWAANKNTVSSPTNLVVIDTHKYYTFADKHKSQSPHSIIAGIPRELSETKAYTGNVHDHGAAPIFIGEWSCVLSEETWGRCDPKEKSAFTANFGEQQLNMWFTHTSGSAFWTFKMDWMPGGGWGFKAMTEKGAIGHPTYLSMDFAEVDRRMTDAQSQRDGLRELSTHDHCSYWDKQAPGKEFEHWRFTSGWENGWTDTLTFFGYRREHGLGRQGADRIGCLDGWIRKRLQEVGDGKFIWEWEQGYRHGVGKAEAILFRGLKACSSSKNIL